MDQGPWFLVVATWVNPENGWTIGYYGTAVSHLVFTVVLLTWDEVFKELLLRCSKGS